jgi:uncharacterized protein with beta-barrel porin domain
VSFTYSQDPGTGLVDARDAAGNNVVFTVVSRVAGLALVSGDGQTGPTNGEAAEPFVFVLQGPNGQPLSGETVTFAVSSGSGSVNPTSAVTDSLGRASTRLRFGPSPGSVTVQASAQGGQSVASGTASSFVATILSTSGNNQSAPAGTRLPQPLVVQIAQPPVGAKALGGVPVTWTVTAGGGTLASPTTLTDAQGRASNELTLGPQPGTNTVQANVTGIGTANFTATGTSGSGTGVTLQIVSGNNQALPTFTDSAPLVVRAVNAQGTPQSGLRILWTPVVAGTVALSPTSSTTDASGQASTVARVQLPGAQEVAATIEGNSAPGARFTLNGGVENVPSLDPAEESAGAAIDAACPALFAQSQTGSLDSGESDLLQRCSELVVASGSDPESVQQALDQMVADEALAQGTAAITTTATQFDNLKARLAALRSGSRGVDMGGLALAGGNGSVPLSFLPSTLLAAQDDGGGGSDEAGAAFSRWGFFATGTVGRGNQDASGSEPGFDFDTYGLTAGVDYRVNDDFVLGAALGYNNNDTEIDGDQGGLDTRGWNLSGYGSWYRNAWYLDGVVTWGNNDYDLTRRIRYAIAGLAGGSTSVDQVATASPGSDQLAFALSVGRDFNRGAWSFGPYARATYTRLDFDGYRERMSDPDGPGGGLAVEVDARELKSLEGVIGGKATYTSSRSWGILMPSIQVEWLHEFEDDIENLVSRFANDPTGTDIVVPGEPVDSDYFNLGIGLSAVFANGRSGFLYYEHRAGQENYSQDSLAIGLRLEF